MPVEIVGTLPDGWLATFFTVGVDFTLTARGVAKKRGVGVDTLGTVVSEIGDGEVVEVDELGMPVVRVDELGMPVVGVEIVGEGNVDV